MKIIYKESFVSRLEKQIEYIAKSNPINAIRFKNELIFKMKLISRNPYQFRKSIFFNDDSIRDMIFKGYTIVFRINNDTIEVFGFAKFQNRPVE